MLCDMTEQESQGNSYTIIGVIIVAIIIIGMFFYFRSHSVGSNGPRPVLGQNGTSTTAATGSSAIDLPTTVGGVTGNGNFKVELVGSSDLPKAPNSRTPITFASTVSPDVKSAIQAKVDYLIAQLAKDPTDLSAWINLGTVHKMAGDYATAETFWKYVVAVAPNNSIAYNNLADLYANFLNSPSKAESMYLKAVVMSPHDISIYHNLFDFYTSTKKDAAAAESILKKGIAANPDAIDLHVLLARYYKAHGRTDEAAVEYQAAITSATAQHLTDAANQIKVEAGQY
jgi:Tfp pilus assembly protein PilF